jgi:MOSC domain-containing protein YiiM
MTKTYERGTEVLNHRQISLVDEAELAIIAAAMGINALAAGVIADNICTSGVADLTMIPRMTRMKFEGGAVLMLGGENNPCTIAGAMVEAVHGTPPQAFPKAAIHRRGVTAWVEHPGSIHAGEAFTLISP